jgi:hypothetical protein
LRNYRDGVGTAPVGTKTTTQPVCGVNTTLTSSFGAFGGDPLGGGITIGCSGCGA